MITTAFLFTAFLTAFLFASTAAHDTSNPHHEGGNNSPCNCECLTGKRSVSRKYAELQCLHKKDNCQVSHCKKKSKTGFQCCNIYSPAAPSISPSVSIPAVLVSPSPSSIASVSSSPSPSASPSLVARNTTIVSAHDCLDAKWIHTTTKYYVIIITLADGTQFPLGSTSYAARNIILNCLRAGQVLDVLYPIPEKYLNGTCSRSPNECAVTNNAFKCVWSHFGACVADRSLFNKYWGACSRARAHTTH